MRLVNIPLFSSLTRNIFSFAQNHIFSSRHLSISKLSALALTVGVGYFLVQGTRKLVATTTPSKNPEKEKITDHFYRITGKNITEAVYLLGTTKTRPCSEYPTQVVQALMNCQRLVLSLPMWQAKPETVRQFVVDHLFLTLKKLKQRDNDWFRDQFLRIGCRGQYLEEQMELVRKAQTVNLDITLHSWKDNFLLQKIGTPLELCDVNISNTHPLVIMQLLGNELDLNEQSSDGIELELMRKHPSYTMLEERDIMAANLIRECVECLANFNNDEPDAYIARIHMFCTRLELGYPNDKESCSDYYAQPGLYRDRVLTQKDPKDVPLQSTIVAKNLAWRAPILNALQQNQSTAIVIPIDNLDSEDYFERETGMLEFVKSQGYKVELA
jgi:hypothetical protein